MNKYLKSVLYEKEFTFLEYKMLFKDKKYIHLGEKNFIVTVIKSIYKLSHIVHIAMLSFYL